MVKNLKSLYQNLKSSLILFAFKKLGFDLTLIFIIPGYESARFDRDGSQGGGCATFVRDGISFKRIVTSTEIECVIIEVYKSDGNLVVIHFYNPCKALSLDVLEDIIRRQGKRKEIWCGDFNAHNSLWGSKHTDNNGEVVEELMDNRQLVCINNGNGTRIDIRSNILSCIDLTLVSNNLASYCEWNINDSTSIGSDHFPINQKYCFGKRSIELCNVSEFTRKNIRGSIVFI